MSLSEKPHVVDIETPKLVEDEVMTSREKWVLKTPRVHGWIESVTSKEQIFQQKESEKITERFHCDAGIDIEPKKDRIKWRGKYYRPVDKGFFGDVQIVELEKWE